MSEIEDLLAEVRKHEPARARRGSRIALAIAGVGVGAAVIAGGVLGVSAAANIAQAGLADQPTADSVQEVSAATIADPTADPAAPDSDAVSNPDAAPAAGAESAPPEYDATTDISTIPRPSADWPVDVEVWLEQQAIIADCMLEQGYEYVFTPYSAHPPGPAGPHLPRERGWRHDLPERNRPLGSPRSGIG